MPFCTIEEAWGENIYNTSKSIDNGDNNYLHSENIISTSRINSSSKRTKRKSKKKSSKYNNLNMDDYIKNLKKENDELRNTITQLKENIDQLQMRTGSGLQRHIKMGLIDIILYILTGIFVVFIIDLILKYNKKPSILPNNDNIF
tara:strand:+ start:100 stop:534 length:435 start_codon:yes stop_codon:yes gene_type:complete